MSSEHDNPGLGGENAIAEREKLEYVVDANDVIVQVNDAWARFAGDNRGEEIQHDAVGTWLWQHLAGKEVKHLFRVLLEKVRATGRPVRVPFRCDAPELRRAMMMEVTPLEDRAVRFSSWLVEETERPPIKLLEADREEASTTAIRMCAWCKRIGTESGEWQELEEAFEKGGLFQEYPLPQITHAVCPDCQSLILSRLDQEG